MTHEFDGKEYEKAATHQREWGQKLIGDLALQGDECVLDLGCGDGGLTARIADSLPRGKVVGIDASRGMIEAALPKRRENLTFRLMDIDDLDHLDCYDIIFSNAALHWVKDHRRLLHSVRRALRTGGRLRLNFAGDGNCSHFFGVVREAMASAELAASFSSYEWPFYMPALADYQALIRESGWCNVRVWGENADRHFPDVKAMVRWLDQPCLVPFLPSVPAEGRAAFRDLVVRRMREETEQSDGRCFETFRRINVSATK